MYENHPTDTDPQPVEPEWPDDWGGFLRGGR
jgi:hypothetical protein